MEFSQQYKTSFSPILGRKMPFGKHELTFTLTFKFMGECRALLPQDNAI